jgi:hypothetical protein
MQELAPPLLLLEHANAAAAIATSAAINPTFFIESPPPPARRPFFVGRQYSVQSRPSQENVSHRQTGVPRGKSREGEEGCARTR